MLVQRIVTHSFRNLSFVQIDLDPGINVVWGKNAQGKTNLLEAIYLAVTRRSFRAQRTEEMIQFGCSEARVQADINVGSLEYVVKVALSEERREVVINDKVVRSSRSAPKNLTTVLFTPDDLRIAKAGPQYRRRLLDDAVTAVWPSYAKILRDYAKVLSNRNKVLKEGNSTPDLLDVYDEQLAQVGATIVTARRRYIDKIGHAFTTNFATIAANDSGVLRYAAPDDLIGTPMDQQEQYQQLRRLLMESRRRDLLRRHTSVGPHQHDMEFEVNGYSARLFASQGQARALVLAFKIAQILDIYGQCGSYPLLLLDDVSSELDPERNTYLFDFIKTIACQLVVTTTRPDLVNSGNKSFCFQIVNGCIST